MKKNFAIAVVSFCFTALVAGFYINKSRLSSAHGRTPSGGDVEQSEVSFEELRSDILKSKIHSAEDMLRFFRSNARYLPFLQSVILEKQSFALHADQVSGAFPRIAMGSGKLILHLTGDPTRLGNNLVEVVEYNSNEGLFDFSLIHFSPNNGDPEFISNADITLSASQVKTLGIATGGTVRKCAGCHINGFLDGHKFSNLNWSTSSGLFRAFGHDQGKIGKGTQEYDDFQKYLNTLKDPKLGALYQLLPQSFSVDANGDIDFPGNPVQRFTSHTFSLGNKKVAESFRKFSAYSEYQYALAGALLNCPNIAGFLTSDSRDQHEFWLRKASVDDTGFQIRLGSLKQGDLDASFWKTLSGRDSITGAEFFQHTTLPFLDAFSVEINQMNQAAIEDTVYGLPISAAEKLREQQKIFLAETYVARLSNLLYLFKGYYPEMPMIASIAVNEVAESAELAGPSFRMEGADQSLDSLLSAEFGPTFLMQNPELDQFSHHKMIVQDLQTPFASYCNQLSKFSQAAFKVHPLDPSKTGGQNGDLCGDAPGLCRNPLGCRDRGDGKRTCTGAKLKPGQSSQAGNLCAGRSEQLMCGIGMQCRDRGDQVLACAVRPDGSGQVNDPCDPANVAFCAAGLACRKTGEFGSYECISTIE